FLFISLLCELCVSALCFLFPRFSLLRELCALRDLCVSLALSFSPAPSAKITLHDPHNSLRKNLAIPRSPRGPQPSLPHLHRSPSRSRRHLSPSLRRPPLRRPQSPPPRSHLRRHGPLRLHHRSHSPHPRQRRQAPIRSPRAQLPRIRCPPLRHEQ